MAPNVAGTELSAKRRQFAGEPGFKGLVSNGRTFAIALFASLGGLVYGCMSCCFDFSPFKLDHKAHCGIDNQGMFSSILTMHSFQAEVRKIPSELSLQ